MRLEIISDGDKQVARELTRFSGRFGDARPAFEKIADMLARSEERQFSSQGGFASGGWAPLAQSTLKRRRARGQGTRILQATGRMRAAFTGRSGPDHVEELYPTAMVFGASVPYAKHHQHGTKRMPQRRPLEVREQDRRAMVKTLQLFYVRGR